MYFDAYFAGAFTIVADPGPDQPNGVHLDGPGPLDVVVYAARQLNPGRWHCLLTAAQHNQITDDGVPHIHFSTLPANEKALSGGPAHVFGPWTCEPGATEDEIIIYEPGNPEPIVISNEPEE